MITNIYTIRDKVAEEVGPLFQAKNDAVAIRQFKQLIKDSENPEEYELLCLGDFNDQTIELETGKVKVININIEVIPNA